MPSRRTLIAGYGNVWRGDDGAGPAAIERLDSLLRDANASATAGGSSELRCVAWRQLMPEHALELREVDEAWLVDASIERPPGVVAVRRVRDSDSTATPDPFSHRWSPAALLQLTRQLYGTAPRMRLYTIGVAQLTEGAPLSETVAAAVDRLARRLARRFASSPR